MSNLLHPYKRTNLSLTPMTHIQCLHTSDTCTHWRLSVNSEPTEAMVYFFLEAEQRCSNVTSGREGGVVDFSVSRAQSHAHTLYFHTSYTLIRHKGVDSNVLYVSVF